MKKVRLFLVTLSLFLCEKFLFAQTYLPVNNASSVKVTIKNTGMEVDGKLSGLEGEIQFNPLDLKKISFSVSVDANTINTGIDVRDENLRGVDYLDTKKFPRISFVSKQVTAGGKANSYLVRGTITIKGISKDINMPFTVVSKNDGLVFNGEFRVNRLDFKIGVGSIVLSDGITVSLLVFAKKN
ncbi:MAG: YceI family protein [Sediminibacterium sp.]